MDKKTKMPAIPTVNVEDQICKWLEIGVKIDNILSLREANFASKIATKRPNADLNISM